MKNLSVVPAVPAAAYCPYDEWKRLTRSLKSARLAFARERSLWASLGIDKPERVEISAPDMNYTISPPLHVEAVDNAETLLHASVLVESYAVVVAAAADRLAVSARSLVRIEVWGASLLEGNSRDWTHVEGGLAGAVEVAVARNAFAHGSRTIDAEAHQRLLAAGAHAPPVDSPLTLSYGELCGHRARLLSLLNASGFQR